MKQKAFFIISKGLSIKQITHIFLKGESPTLTKRKQPLIDVLQNFKQMFWKFEQNLWKIFVKEVIFRKVTD